MGANDSASVENGFFSTQNLREKLSRTILNTEESYPREAHGSDGAFQNFTNTGFLRNQPVTLTVTSLFESKIE